MSSALKRADGDSITFNSNVYSFCEALEECLHIQNYVYYNSHNHHSKQSTLTSLHRGPTDEPVSVEFYVDAPGRSGLGYSCYFNDDSPGQPSDFDKPDNTVLEVYGYNRN